MFNTIRESSCLYLFSNDPGMFGRVTIADDQIQSFNFIVRSCSQYFRFTSLGWFAIAVNGLTSLHSDKTN